MILLATMAAISVRGLSDQQLAALKQEASCKGISMNRLALQRLVQEGKPDEAGSSNELDGLAGTWSEREEESFSSAIAAMEQVDPDLWG